jgi:hypothetical protein
MLAQHALRAARDNPAVAASDATVHGRARSSCIAARAAATAADAGGRFWTRSQQEKRIPDEAAVSAGSTRRASRIDQDL